MLLVLLLGLPSLGYAYDYEYRGIWFHSVSNHEVEVSGCDSNLNGDVEIPASVYGKNVIRIGYMAFTAKTSITSVTIPNSVTSIDYYAFKGCSGLTSINIPDGVTTIGNSAFV